MFYKQRVASKNTKEIQWWILQTKDRSMTGLLHNLANHCYNSTSTLFQCLADKVGVFQNVLFFLQITLVNLFPISLILGNNYSRALASIMKLLIFQCLESPEKFKTDNAERLSTFSI